MKVYKYYVDAVGKRKCYFIDNFLSKYVFQVNLVQIEVKIGKKVYRVCLKEAQSYVAYYKCLFQYGFNVAYNINFRFILNMNVLWYNKCNKLWLTVVSVSINVKICLL